MRTICNLNSKWAFTKMAESIPDTMPEKWDWVNLPHTWNALDGQDGGADYYRGVGYYAKELSMTEAPKAERYYLEINGANSSADLYVNGTHLAHHDGGYSTWRADITDALKNENLIVITVDNSPNERVYPQMADFTFYGGLYRDVNLICVNSSHFDLDYFGGPGFTVTPEIIEGNARVKIESYVTNLKNEQSICYRIFDAQGQLTAECESSDTSAVLDIENVHLWHGRRDPYLYTAEISLVEGDAVLDTVSTHFGCRTFRVDPENGFILNGEEYPLRGVARHQDRLGIGNALLPEHHREDADLIYEMGATTIRLAHYQHDRYFYDLCDEYGFIVWAEIPYISKHMPTGRDNTVSQMKELIVQNYNHPSIICWGLSNEISIGGTDDDLLENHRILNDLVHEMDGTRLTTMAFLSPFDINDPFVELPDIVSYNHYFGWYGGDVSMNGPWFDKFHAEHPDIPIGCSEYGCEALNWHTSNPFQGDYTEEYQAYYHEELIKQLFSRKYIWATHVWNMFDFGADARSEGGENGQNHKGLVTMDRKYKKDSFYAYKAWLSDEPFVHICGKRYVDRVEDTTTVTVYSNQPKVELYVNGVKLCEKECPDHFFHFDVPNSGTTYLTAVSGMLRDESRIRKVDVFNEDYRFKEKGAVLNWFDINTVDGYLSLNDKISDIMATEDGGKLIAGILSNPDKKDGSVKAAGFSFDENSPMMDMLGGFTFLRFIGMMGTSGPKLTKEQLLEINDKLNKIEKK